MGERILNSLISATFGALAAVAVVWYLGVAEPVTPENGTPLPAAPLDEGSVKNGKFDELETARLKVTDCVMVCDSVTGEPMIELRAGSILAKKKIVADSFGGNLITGRKVQITPGDPSQTEPPIFSELATNDEGGAYFALLSPKGTHSINMGFDKKETGFIISQNNLDSAMVAQAILPLPSKNQSDSPLLSAGEVGAPNEPPQGSFPLPASAPLTPVESSAPQVVPPLIPTSVPETAAAPPRQGVSLSENGLGTPRGLF